MQTSEPSMRNFQAEKRARRYRNPPCEEASERQVGIGFRVHLLIFSVDAKELALPSEYFQRLKLRNELKFEETVILSEVLQFWNVWNCVLMISHSGDFEPQSDYSVVSRLFLSHSHEAADGREHAASAQHRRHDCTAPVLR